MYFQRAGYQKILSGWPVERQIRRTPGGGKQDQAILQAFLNIVEFWPDWYPNLHEAFEWPRAPGFNKLDLESPSPMRS